MAEPKAVRTTGLNTELARVSTVDLVASRIEELIFERELRPGEVLPAERELAAQLKVSRNVLREALRTLAQKGLLRVIQGRGAFVTEPSTEPLKASISTLLRLRHVGLEDLCDARLLLEPEVAALAARRATPAEHERLRELVGALEKSKDDAAAHVEADLALHRGISDAAHHSVYGAITEAVRIPVTRSMLVGTRVPRAIDASDDHHREIVAAIIASDEDRARLAMTEHMRYVRDYIEERERKTKRSR